MYAALEAADYMQNRIDFADVRRGIYFAQAFAGGCSADDPRDINNAYRCGNNLFRRDIAVVISCKRLGIGNGHDAVAFGSMVANG